MPQNIFQAEFVMDSSDVESSFQNMERQNADYAASLRKTIEETLKLKHGTAITREQISQVKELIRLERERHALMREQNREFELSKARSQVERDRINQDYDRLRRDQQQSARQTDEAFSRGSSALLSSQQSTPSQGIPGASAIGNTVGAIGQGIGGTAGSALSILSKGGAMAKFSLLALGVGAAYSFGKEAWQKAVERDEALQEVLASTQGRYAGEAGAIKGSATFSVHSTRMDSLEAATKLSAQEERLKEWKEENETLAERNTRLNTNDVGNTAVDAYLKAHPETAKTVGAGKYIPSKADFDKMNRIRLKLEAGEYLSSDERKFADRASRAYGPDFTSAWNFMTTGGFGEERGAGITADLRKVLEKQLNKVKNTSQYKKAKEEESWFENAFSTNNVDAAAQRTAARQLLQSGYTPSYESYLKAGQKVGWSEKRSELSSGRFNPQTGDYMQSITHVNRAYAASSADEMTEYIGKLDTNFEKLNKATEARIQMENEIADTRRKIEQGVEIGQYSSRWSHMGFSETEALKFIKAAIQINPNIQYRNNEGYHLAMYSRLGFEPGELGALNPFYDSGQKRSAGETFSMLDRLFRQGQDFPALRKYMETFQQLLPSSVQSRTLQSGTETGQVAQLMKNLEDTFSKYGHSIWTGAQQSQTIQLLNQSFQSQDNDWVEAFRYRANERIWNAAIRNPKGPDSFINPASENYNAQLAKMYAQGWREFNPYLNSVISQQGIYTSPVFTRGMISDLTSAFRGDRLAQAYAFNQVFGAGQNYALGADIQHEAERGNYDAFTSRGYSKIRSGYSEYDTYATTNQELRAEKDDAMTQIGQSILSATEGIQETLINILNRLNN